MYIPPTDLLYTIFTKICRKYDKSDLGAISPLVWLSLFAAQFHFPVRHMTLTHFTMEIGSKIKQLK